MNEYQDEEMSYIELVDMEEVDGNCVEEPFRNQDRDFHSTFAAYQQPQLDVAPNIEELNEMEIAPKLE